MAIGMTHSHRLTNLGLELSASGGPLSLPHRKVLGLSNSSSQRSMHAQGKVITQLSAHFQTCSIQTQV